MRRTKKIALCVAWLTLSGGSLVLFACNGEIEAPSLNPQPLPPGPPDDEKSPTPPEQAPVNDGKATGAGSGVGDTTASGGSSGNGGASGGAPAPKPDGGV